MYQVGDYIRSNFTGAGVAVFATPSFSRHSFLASIVRCSAFYIPRTMGGAAQHEHLWYSFSCACAPRIRRNRAVIAASSACGCTSCGPFFSCLRQADKDITFRPQHTPRCRETILCLLASVSPLGSIAKTPHDCRENTGTAPRTTKLVVTPPPPHSPLAKPLPVHLAFRTSKVPPRLPGAGGKVAGPPPGHHHRLAREVPESARGRLRLRRGASCGYGTQQGLPRGGG